MVELTGSANFCRRRSHEHAGRGMLLPGDAALFVLVFVVTEDQQQEAHRVGIVHFCDRRPARHCARPGPMGPAGQRETQAGA